MSKKHKGGAAPIPTANQSHFGPHQPVENVTPAKSGKYDPKRRLGEQVMSGAARIEQPGGKQGAQH